METLQRAELQVPIPYVLALPFWLEEGAEALPQPEVTLEGLGIRPEQVRERLVRLDRQHTRLRTSRGRLKERLVWTAEVSLWVREPLIGGTQEIHCASEGWLGHSFFRTQLELLPWISRMQGDALIGTDGVVEEEEMRLVGLGLVLHTKTDPYSKGQKHQEQQSV